MEIIYILIPISLVLVAVIVGFVFWAVRNGQFEDMDRPGHAILDDDDSVRASGTSSAGVDTEERNDGAT